MGCRTRANEYYMEMSRRQVQQNSETDLAVEGNVVRRIVPEQAPPERINRSRKIRRSRRMQQALKRQKARFVLLGAAASVLVIGLGAVMLSSLELYGDLTQEVSRLETQANELTVYNDAREYEISSSVDLNYVITVATQELGMVRSNASQIITYSVKNSEYLQQVAQVPGQ